VTRNGEDPLAIRHHDVLPLTRDSEPRLLEGAHRIEMIDAWYLRQGLHRYLDFSDLFAFKLLFDH
jgi:hypothetical protein